MGRHRQTEEVQRKIFLICFSSASIQFANGTISDVALIHGTEAYIRAMKLWDHLDVEPPLLDLENK